MVLRDLTELRPADGGHWCCLGRLLLERGDRAGAAEALEKAVATIRAAIRLKPDLAAGYNILGAVLGARGKVDEAIAEYRAAIRLEPDLAKAHYNLGIALKAHGKVDEAIAEYRAAIRFEPDLAEAHCNLGNALLTQGKFREALAELRRGHELGSKRPGWAYPSANWVRRAERRVVLEGRLPAVLRGFEKPKDAAETLEVADLAYEAKQFDRSAQLYVAAFQAEPKLAEDMGASSRYDAACAAARAGAGTSDNKPPLVEPEKARWRKQAIDWLKADLAHWTRQVEAGKPEAKRLVRQKLRQWKDDTDLAGIRDEALVKGLPEGEQKDCRALWAEVDALLKRVEAC